MRSQEQGLAQGQKLRRPRTQQLIFQLTLNAEETSLRYTCAALLLPCLTGLQGDTETRCHSVQLFCVDPKATTPIARVRIPEHTAPLAVGCSGARSRYSIIRSSTVLTAITRSGVMTHQIRQQLQQQQGSTLESQELVS